MLLCNHKSSKGSNTMTNLNVRIDENLKNDVDKILRRLGLSFSDAVRIFFARICEERGIPFELKLPREYEKWTSQAIADTEKDIKDGRVSESFKTIEDLMSSLDTD